MKILLKNSYSFYENQDKNIVSLYFNNKRYKDLVEMKTEDLLKK